MKPLDLDILFHPRTLGLNPKLKVLQFCPRQEAHRQGRLRFVELPMAPAFFERQTLTGSSS